MTFAIRHPEGSYFTRFDVKKGVCFTRSQEKADFFPDKASALARWDEEVAKARAAFLKPWESVSPEDQLKQLTPMEAYWHEQSLKAHPELAKCPIRAKMPNWMRWPSAPPLFEIPDPQALSEQVSLFMARSGGKWVVSNNNAEGLTLSDSCDKAPCFLSISAGEHFLSRHRFPRARVVFVEFAAFAKAADPAPGASLDAFEQGINARAEGREIRLSLESPPASSGPAPARRKLGL